MLLTLDISNEEFDAIVDSDGDFTPTIFLHFPSDIRGIYEFELLNTVIDVYNFKDQIQNQGFHVKDDSLFVFGKMNVHIEGVKGADIKFIKGNLLTGHEHYHSWPYTIDKGDTVCKCGGKPSFLDDYYVTLMIVTESKPKITLTFNIEETVPFDFMNSNSVEEANQKKVEYKQTKSHGKLFDFGFFQEHFGSGRIAVKNE
jgi:hypothetical protein